LYCAVFMVMDARRLAELIDAHAPALVLYARQWCAAPEDVVQEAFCKLASARSWPDDPQAWLFRVVRNAAIDAGRSDHRRVRREASVARPVRWFVEPGIDGLDAAFAVAALESLPCEQREVIVARLWGGMTFEQFAAIAGCSASSAHRRFEAGLDALREKLGASCPKTK
jgi:DNA-directed RNA polymerase specialized sigma24 family protein